MAISDLSITWSSDSFVATEGPLISTLLTLASGASLKKIWTCLSGIDTVAFAAGSLFSTFMCADRVAAPATMAPTTASATADFRNTFMGSSCWGVALATPDRWTLATPTAQPCAAPTIGGRRRTAGCSAKGRRSPHGTVRCTKRPGPCCKRQSP